MILLIDNYDSFVYNIARYLAELGQETRVVRNDAISVADVQRLAPAAIVLSPGPRTPREAGISVAVVQTLGKRTPILGVCLGHQAIAAAFGTDVVRASEPIHGRTTLVYHDGRNLFEGLPNALRATRYHSLIVPRDTLAKELKVTAWTDDSVVMGLRHQDWPVFGIQFHPESILTQGGHHLLRNFLYLCGMDVPHVPHGEQPDTDSIHRSQNSVDWSDTTQSDGKPLHW